MFVTPYIELRMPFMTLTNIGLSSAANLFVSNRIWAKRGVSPLITMPGVYCLCKSLPAVRAVVLGAYLCRVGFEIGCRLTSFEK